METTIVNWGNIGILENSSNEGYEGLSSYPAKTVLLFRHASHPSHFRMKDAVTDCTWFGVGRGGGEEGLVHLPGCATGSKTCYYQGLMLDTYSPP